MTIPSRSTPPPRARRPGLALVITVFALAACQIVAGIDRVEKETRKADGSTGGGEGGTQNPIPSDDPCNHVVPPPLPDNDDDRDGVIPPFFLAVRTPSLLPKAPDGTFSGLDLDNVCTCDTRPGTARAGASSCEPKQKDCDADGGADNKASTLFEQFALTGTSVDSSILGDIDQGKQGLLLQISEWNGKPNDRQIKVGVLVSTGITDSRGCGNTTTDDGEHFYPGWCGQDRWNYPPESVASIGGTRYAVPPGIGYVANNQLVFRSEGAITMFFGRATVTFGTPITLGTLTPHPNGFKLTGMLGGRLAVDELLGAIGQFNVSVAGGGGGKQGLCKSPLFVTLKDFLCGSADINRTNAFDFKEGPCNALSSAVTFTAEPAELGDPLPRAEIPTECSPATIGPAAYKCP